MIVAVDRASVFNWHDADTFMTEICAASGMPDCFICVDCLEIYLQATAALGGDPSGDYQGQ